MSLEETTAQLARLMKLVEGFRVVLERPHLTKEEYRKIHLDISMVVAERMAHDNIAGVVFSAWRDSERCICYNAEQVPVEWLGRLGELAPGSAALHVFTTEERGEADGQ